MKTCSECDQIKADDNFTSEDETTITCCDNCLDNFNMFVTIQLRMLKFKAALDGVNCNLTIDDVKTIYFKENRLCEKNRS